MMKRILFLASLLIGLALAFAPLDAPRVIAQTFSGQPSPGYVQIGQVSALPKWGPVSATSQIDVFLLIGSSNTVGQGTSPQSPIAPASALMYCNASASSPGITHLVDPVCSSVSTSPNWNANSGSMWPAFAISYGRPVAVVQTAVSGSTQASACDFNVGNGNWQATTAGSNYANSLAAINTALTAFNAAGYNPVFRGIIQNELGVNDAAQIDSSVCTVGQYTAAYNAMAANWRAAAIGGKVYPSLPIFMSLVPTNTSPTLPEVPGYAAVRGAQLGIAAADGNTLIDYSGAVSFGPRGLLQAGSVHPTQAGYNEWGYFQGGAILPFVPGNIPFKVFNANTGALTLPTTNPVVEIVAADANSLPLVMYTFSGINGFDLFSAGGTGAAPAATSSGNLIGSLGMRGYGATKYLTTNQAAFNCLATQNFTDAVAGTECSIFVTPNNTSTSVQGLGIFNGNSVVLGPADATTPTAQTLSVQNVLVGTSNTSGANLILAGSRGTGSGIGGSVQIEVAPAGGVATSQNTLTPFFTMLGNGNIGFGTETNPQIPFIFSLNAMTGVNVGAMSAFNGPWAVGATGALVGWNVLSVAGQGNNVFARIDNTIGSPQNLGSGETIGTVGFGGWGNGILQGARANINAITGEPWNSTFGVGLQFNTVPVGGARAQVMYLKGGVIIGSSTADPGANTYVVTSQAFASLAASPLAGTVAYINDGKASNCGDASCTTWGTTVTAGGGALNLMIWRNGTNWTLIGK